MHSLYTPGDPIIAGSIWRRRFGSCNFASNTRLDGTTREKRGKLLTAFNFDPFKVGDFFRFSGILNGNAIEKKAV